MHSLQFQIDLLVIQMSTNCHHIISYTQTHIYQSSDHFNPALANYFMEDKQYQGLEKKFHLLQDKHLRELSSQNEVPYGTAAVICKAFVDKVKNMILNSF